jgi:hypothetical protein
MLTWLKTGRKSYRKLKRLLLCPAGSGCSKGKMPSGKKPEV